MDTETPTLQSSHPPPPPSQSPGEEVPELSTTVDPSYIIHLIRQLLPPTQMKELRQQFHGRDDATKPALADPINEMENSMDQQEHQDISFSNRTKSDTKGTQLTSSSVDQSCLDKQDISASEPQPCNTPSAATPHFSEEQREEAGCMLWDLAATQSHAEFMVKNHILDVLLAILGVHPSDRLREICLGILGNLACHAEPVKAIVQTPGLPNEVVQNLFVEDAPSLSEACRLLSASLHSEQVEIWVKFINTQGVLERVLWIAANTMNSLLLEKSTELLLAMVDIQESMASVLISSLVHLGLTAVITDLLASEISAFNEGTCSRGNVVLDTILQIAEALSLADDAAGQLADNSKLFNLACQVIQLSEKEEVGPAGISAAVLVANLLAEKEDLVQGVAQDVVLIKQVVELLPSAWDDPGAGSALWSILGRLSMAYSKSSSEDASNATTEVPLAFAEGCNVLLDHLQDHQDAEDPEEAESLRGYTVKLETVESILHVLEDWIASQNSRAEDNEAYNTIYGSSCALRCWLKSKELEDNQKQNVKHASLPNGTKSIG